jgi:hypothetical protein
MKVGDGRDTSFWCDSWCDQIPLKDRFPGIYDICIEQNVSVAEAADMHWNFSFRRWMTPDLASNPWSTPNNVSNCPHS